MKTTSAVIALSLSITFSFSASAETHPKVQSALDWELPVNECSLPGKDLRLKITNEEGVSEAGFREDPGKVRLREKRKKKFDKCVEKYKKGLVTEFGELREVAQYGLTQEQADTILGKLSLIQAVIQDPMARPPGEQ